MGLSFAASKHRRSSKHRPRPVGEILECLHSVPRVVRQFKHRECNLGDGQNGSRVWSHAVQWLSGTRVTAPCAGAPSACEADEGDSNDSSRLQRVPPTPLTVIAAVEHFLQVGPTTRALMPWPRERGTFRSGHIQAHSGPYQLFGAHRIKRSAGYQCSLAELLFVPHGRRRLLACRSMSGVASPQ